MSSREMSRAEVRDVDRWAIEVIGIPGIVLMENAAKNAADTIRQRYFAGKIADRAVILCGTGNNGGDGFAIARHLANHEIDVSIGICGSPEKLAADARTNYDIVRAMGITPSAWANESQIVGFANHLRTTDLVIDALLGTGFAGSVRAPMSELIRRINVAPKAGVVAVDVPSGLDCDTGQVANVAIKADLTLTFVATKPGFKSAGNVVGEVVVADIGIRPMIVENSPK